MHDLQERSLSNDREPSSAPSDPDGGMPIEVLQLLPRIWGAPATGSHGDAELVLSRLRALAELRAELDAIEDATVRNRGYRVRFEDVAEALGISKSAAHRRWGAAR